MDLWGGGLADRLGLAARRGRLVLFVNFAPGDQLLLKSGSLFDGLRVEDCFFHDVSFYGILVSGWENRFRGDGWFPSTGVVIRNNGNGYLLLCSPDQSVPGTEGIVVRYHLSVNDGTTPKNGIFNPLPASFHRDPAERLIVASAQVKGLALATHDRKLQYACSLPIWKGVSSCNFGF
ncbi:MAG: hypothetical protein ACO3NW_07890 [Kiritimatiellia bacterium]